MRSLSTNPDYYRYAVALMDGVRDTLAYLCNYNTATDGNNEQHDMESVIDDLTERLDTMFHKLTGREYIPEIVRRIEDRFLSN